MKPGEVNPNLVLPVGTRIVTRIEVKTDSARALRPVGAVAEIVAVPADALHSYRVKFPDGAQASVRRREFSIWSQYREEAAGGPDPLIDHELFARHVIYRCVVGSKAYGLDGPGSDVDRRGIYLPPAELHWSLYGVPEQPARRVPSPRNRPPEKLYTICCCAFVSGALKKIAFSLPNAGRPDNSRQ